MSDSSRAAEFLAKFHTERDAITSTIENLQTKSVSANDVTPLATRISQLSASLTAAMDFLPAYDQRLCNQQISALEGGVDKLRQKVPKSRFAFKKKEATATPPPAAAAASVPAPSSAPLPQATASNPATTSRKGAYITLKDVLADSSATATDVILSDLEGCIIDLVPQGPASVSALYGRDLRGCLVITGEVSGSARLENCTNCVIIAASRQFRLERCHKSDVYLHVKSVPVIEQSKEIRFAPYPAELLPAPIVEESQHTAAKDFSWIQSTPSPNWSSFSSGHNWGSELEVIRKGGDEGWIKETLKRYID